MVHRIFAVRIWSHRVACFVEALPDAIHQFNKARYRSQTGRKLKCLTKVGNRVSPELTGTALGSMSFPAEARNVNCREGGPHLPETSFGTYLEQVDQFGDQAIVVGRDREEPPRRRPLRAACFGALPRRIV